MGELEKCPTKITNDLILTNLINEKNEQLEKLQEQNKEKDSTIENLRENFAFQKFELIRLMNELNKREAENKIIKRQLELLITTGRNLIRHDHNCNIMTNGKHGCSCGFIVWLDYANEALKKMGE